MSEDDKVTQLLNLVGEFGWSIAVPNSGDENCPGLIIGQENYINDILQYLPDDMDYSSIK